MALTLVEAHELHSLQVPALGDGFRRQQIEWHHLPIVDVSEEAFHRLWRVSGPAVLHTLHRGGKVLVHCRGGLGRAGTVAAALLIELGETPQEALRKVRSARPGAVETRGQERYIASYKRMFDPKQSVDGLV